jgi:LysM repeat protein
MERAGIAAIAGMVIFACASPSAAQSLRGSTQSMQQQHRVAIQHDYTFIQTSAQLRRFVDLGLLVPVRGNASYELAAVSYPYARAALKLFIERLSQQYQAACGEKLVVTSLARPVREQPRNASDLSVHPAGMAVDLRVSRSAACRSWLERTLLSLEKQGVLNATRENRPPHYHVALYPTPYTRYVAAVTNARGNAQLAAAVESATARAGASPSGTTAASGPSESSAAPATAGAQAEAGLLVSANVAEAEAEMPDSGPAPADAELLSYRVSRGDSLWSIARRYNTTVDTLKELNGLRGSAIRAGDVLTVPGTPAGTDGSLR